jgi:hypothetical protein
VNRILKKPARESDCRQGSHFRASLQLNDNTEKTGKFNFSIMGNKAMAGSQELEPFILCSLQVLMRCDVTL